MLLKTLPSTLFKNGGFIQFDLLDNGFIVIFLAPERVNNLIIQECLQADTMIEGLTYFCKENII